MEKIHRVTNVEINRLADSSIQVKATGFVTSMGWKNPVLTEESRLSGELILCFQADRPNEEQGPPPIRIKVEQDFSSDGIREVTIKDQGGRGITKSVPV